MKKLIALLVVIYLLVGTFISADINRDKWAYCGHGYSTAEKALVVTMWLPLYLTLPIVHVFTDHDPTTMNCNNG